MATLGSIPNCAVVPAEENRDIGQLLGGGIRVDRAIAVDEYPIGQAHQGTRWTRSPFPAPS